MTDAATQRVLDRFVEADALLRQAHEHITGLTAARATAEASAAGLGTAANAVAAYAEAARVATATTERVQEQAARALREAEKLSASFDSSQLLVALTALQVQVTELQQRADAAAERIDVRLAELEQAVAPLPASIEALARRLTKQTSTQLVGVRAEVEAVRDELRTQHEDDAEQRDRLEQHIMQMAERLEILISTGQARGAEDAQMLSGIVDVLPKRSRRRLGR